MDSQVISTQSHPVQVESAPQYFVIQTDGSGNSAQTEYVLSDLGELGENTIIMFEEGVGAEETVSSDEYVTYVVPSKELKSEYDLLGDHYSEVTYQHDNKVELRDAIANMGTFDCKEETIEETRTGVVHHENGDVMYEIKSEVHYDNEEMPKRVYFNNYQPLGQQIYKVAEQPLNLVKKETFKPSPSSRHFDADLVKCKLCNSYVVGSKIDIHNRDIHSNYNSLTCPDCGKLFTSKRSLVGHKKEKHSGTLEIFPCAECGKNFSRRSNLKAHMDSIHYGKKFPCSYCDRIFTNRSCMNLHVKKTHSDLMSL